MNSGDLLVYLVSCAVNKTAPDSSALEKADLNELFVLAKRHSVSALAAYALKKAGVDDERFKEAENKAMRKSLLFDNISEKLFAFLRENNIRYTRLKGSVIKTMYPLPWLRESTDIDVYYDSSRKSDIEAFFTGWEKHSESPHHDSYHKEPLYNIEMHSSLFDDDNQLAAYYKDVDKRFVSVDGSEFAFTDSDMYVYFVAHAYNHYSVSGVGLRTLADCLLILGRCGGIDREYTKKEFEKLGIAEFAELLEGASLKLLGQGGEALTDKEKTFADTVITAGTFGTYTGYVHKKMERINGSGSKSSYFIKRLFPPASFMKKAYPVCEKHKYLLPFCYAHRAAVRAFKRRKAVSAEIKAASAKQAAYVKKRK